MGWERANFFAPPGERPVIEYAWGQQNWQPWSSAEQRAARTAVAVFDQTSFSKYLVTGRDAERVLQWLCTNDVAVEPGRTVYTGLLNARGTYEGDITVTRLKADEFLLVSSASSTERDKDHIRARIPAEAHASLVDVTSAYAVYGVMGPRSRDLLSRLSRADFGDEAFPFGPARRRRGRPGHLRRLGRGPRRLRGPGLHPPPRRRCPHHRPRPSRLLPGQRRRRSLPRRPSSPPPSTPPATASKATTPPDPSPPPPSRARPPPPRPASSGSMVPTC
jgi:sarcosine oxidase gamma subunit